jgi:signal transduction histidine kinase
MRLSLQTRLSLSYLVVVLVSMAAIALLVWLAVEQLYLSTQRENLLAQARLTAAALEGQPLPETLAEPYTQAANVLPGIHTRLLSEQGAVVLALPFTSDTGFLQAPPIEDEILVSPEELRQRPEILEALQGVPATAIRRIAAADDKRVIYAAAPISGQDGGVIGIVYLAMPLPTAGLPTDTVLQLSGTILIAVVIALLAAWLLSRRIAQPVEAIARASLAVSAGDLTRRVPVEGTIRELESLGQSFNHMTDSLDRAEQAKNAFIADITHELRTPLTVVKGTIETLEDGALDDAEGRHQLLDSMQRETDRLIRLVNDLLVLTRADAGVLKLNLQPLELRSFVRARGAHFSILAGRRLVNLNLEQKTDEQPACVLADADRLAQVLDNLLDNALRYSPEGSTITLTVYPVEGRWACSIRDQGPGIPPRHLPFIFERFYRVDASRNRGTGGTGLGLAIARSLMLAQNGTITVESDEGQGTVLTILLPAVQNCPETDRELTLS